MGKYRKLSSVTASEESFESKREYTTLSIAGKNVRVPVLVVHSLAKMSNMERRDLKSKLQKEVKQVQTLYNRLDSVHAVYPPSDSSPGRTVVQHGKKRGDILWDKCGALLDRLLEHNDSWLFDEPVDPVWLQIPDYFDVIKHPMDLGTVGGKLGSGVYSSPLDFCADVRLTFANAMKYNPPDNDVHIIAAGMRNDFEANWKEIEKLMMSDNVQTPTPFTSVTHLSNEPKSKKKVMLIMTDAHKQKLSAALESLGRVLPESIADFLKEQSSLELTSDNDIMNEIEFLDDGTLLKLWKLVDDYLQTNKDGVRDGAQISNKPAVSSSLLPSCKGDDGSDEDVDILGGIDSPMSSFTPVEIEKDAEQSDSSSSSDSTSSSNDPDSAGSAETVQSPEPVSLQDDPLQRNASSPIGMDDEMPD